ncbi:MAG: lysophospholipid acyltransferase family protein [Candidatus Dormibacteria bacterium]
MVASSGRGRSSERWRASDSGPAPGARLDGTQSGLLTLTRAVLGLLVRLEAKGGLQIAGQENVPREGGLLVCSNHLSNFDTFIYAAAMPRVMHALAKSELYQNPLLRAFLLRCNCIPVRRGGADRTALRGALAVLNSGGALLLFPEGHRAGSQGLLKFAPGAGFLALRSGAVVLPCALWGTESVLAPGGVLPRRGRIWLRLGRPFQPEADEPARVSQEIRGRVAAMLPPRYRGSADPD